MALSSIGSIVFWQTTQGLMAHLTILTLLGLSAYFYISDRNRMPLLITGVFASATVLASLGAPEAAPLFLVIPIAFALSLLFYSVRKDILISDFPNGVLAALLLAEAFWFLSFWPFGEQTVGAVFASIFFVVSETVDSQKYADLGNI